MKIFYSSQFARQYRKLPLPIQLLAEKKEKIFRKKPFSAVLKTHKLKGKLGEFWSFSVDYKHRIIFEFLEGKIVRFHSIGDHDVYQ